MSVEINQVLAAQFKSLHEKCSEAAKRTLEREREIERERERERERDLRWRQTTPQ